jgi:hypothetical protein
MRILRLGNFLIPPAVFLAPLVCMHATPSSSDFALQQAREEDCGISFKYVLIVKPGP